MINNAAENKLPISVFIITFNEEIHLERLLTSVKDFNEVVIVDSGSTDDTLAIAERHGVTVYHQEWLGFAKQKQYAMSLCTNEWVLSLDGDEALNTNIISRMSAIIKNNIADSVKFRRNDIFINKKSSPLSKLPKNRRFYKKSRSHFDSSVLVHETAIVDGTEVFANEMFDHYGYNNISILTEKNNQYSGLKALEKHQKNIKSSFAKLLYILPFILFKELIFQRQIFNGRRGFIKSIISAHYAFSKEAKLFELEQEAKYINAQGN
jgi:glycosyltransferase involved in cell wall biosynthesis